MHVGSGDWDLLTAKYEGDVALELVERAFDASEQAQPLASPAIFSPADGFTRPRVFGEALVVFLGSRIEPSKALDDERFEVAAAQRAIVLRAGFGAPQPLAVCCQAGILVFERPDAFDSLFAREIGVGRDLSGANGKFVSDV